MGTVTARQKEIIEHSIALIARKGIQELTMRNLSREIGISDPAIYRHFASKTDILLGVLDVLEHETLSRLELSNRSVGDGNADAMSTETARARGARNDLEYHFHTLFVRLSSAPDLSAVIFADEFFLNEEALVQRVRSLMDHTQIGVERLVKRAQDAGELCSVVLPSELATMLIGAVRLLVRRWHIGGHSFDLEREGMNLVHAFMTLATKDR